MTRTFHMFSLLLLHSLIEKLFGWFFLRKKRMKSVFVWCLKGFYFYFMDSSKSLIHKRTIQILYMSGNFLVDHRKLVNSLPTSACIVFIFYVDSSWRKYKKEGKETRLRWIVVGCCEGRKKTKRIERENNFSKTDSFI